MPVWTLLVDLTRFSLFAAAHLFGGSVGAGIFALSLIVRVALLPLTIRTARALRAHREQLAALAPEIASLRKRYAKNPLRLNEATVELYRARGLSLAPKGMLASVLQLPVGAAIYRAVMSSVSRGTRFLWIRDLTRPDVRLALIAAAIAALVARANGGDQQRAAMAIGATLTFIFAWRMSASIALYSVAWSGVSAIEAFFVGRTKQPA